jgi:malonyl-CoA O-methyltransferase
MIPEVRRRFSAQAQVYDEFAVVQKRSARALAEFALKRIPAAGIERVLDIGTGTGFMIENLLPALPASCHVVASDVSREMLEASRKKFSSDPGRVKHVILDMDTFGIRRNFSLIVSNFAVQWSEHLEKTVTRFIDHVREDGYVALAYPNDLSFAEWREACKRLDVPFTANPLPNLETLANVRARSEIWSETDRRDYAVTYPSIDDFFRSLRAIGAGTKTTVGKKRLPAETVQKLANGLRDRGSFTITYSVDFILMKKLRSGRSSCQKI